MMTTMMTPPIIFVPAKRATCWQRNARDRATGHRHYTRCCCAGGCAHFSLTAASSSSSPILFGCFRKLSSGAHFHFCNTCGFSSDGCWWHSKFQPSGSPRVFTGYVVTHALPGLGQRSARILDPGNSRRESATLFLARPREMIFWSLNLVSKHESNKMESRSRLEIREWSYDNLDLVSPGEGKKNNSWSRLEK